MKTIDILRVARDRIAQGWCTHARGLTADGQQTYGCDPRAVKWCAMGAIEAATGLKFEKNWPAVEAMTKLAQSLPGPDKTLPDVVYYNNHGSQEQVLKLFDDTLARLQAPDPAYARFRQTLTEPEETVVA